METHLADFIRATPDGEEAEAILRKCVHCGFCTATCPTYQLLGDELDGPRGRIYLIKQLLENENPPASIQDHLDRCLTCRNCESTCPSGVAYGRLVEIGRKVANERSQTPRPLGTRIIHALLRGTLTRRWLFDPAVYMGQLVRPVLPASLRAKLPARKPSGHWPRSSHTRKVLLLEGCVQPALAPRINAATARVLDAMEIELICAPGAGCCGAIRHHLNDPDGGLDEMRRNIDAWTPYLDGRVEAIVMNASGCGATVKDYGYLLRHDPMYAQRAQRVSEMTRDLAEILSDNERQLALRLGPPPHSRVAFHPPCSLQHGQQIRGLVERVLGAAGITVVLCENSHLCCGSAGTYSILQPVIAQRLRDDKIAALEKTSSEAIVSANIGCLLHLQSGTETPVLHWIEVLDTALAARRNAL